MPKINSVPYLDIYRSNKEFLPQFKNSLEKVLKSGRIVLGSELDKFENEYASFSGTKYAVGVANGLDAIILSLIAIGIKECDEVIVPSNTYIATLIAVTRLNAKPILVEPDPKTYNIDPEKIERAITRKTKAIIPVHLFGLPCEMNKIIKIAKKHKLPVIEDNAQSHGARFDAKLTGSFGIINASSFYPGKNLGALGDGGIITTDSKVLRDSALILRNYGSKIKYYNEVIGYNSRLDELQAAFLHSKLKRLKQNNKVRQNIAKRYIKELAGVGDLILPFVPKNSTHVYHIFAIRTKKRDKLKDYLTSKKIGNLIHYPVPPHLQKAYLSLGYKKGDFPIAEELANTSLSIPIFPEMTKNEQTYVIENIKKFYE